MPLALGTSRATKLYLGDTEVINAYWGEDLVYQRVGLPAFSRLIFLPERFRSEQLPTTSRIQVSATMQDTDTLVVTRRTGASTIAVATVQSPGVYEAQYLIPPSDSTFIFAARNTSGTTRAFKSIDITTDLSISVTKVGGFRSIQSPGFLQVRQDLRIAVTGHPDVSSASIEPDVTKSQSILHAIQGNGEVTVSRNIVPGDGAEAVTYTIRAGNKYDAVSAPVDITWPAHSG